jgi:hypothetical protein
MNANPSLRDLATYAGLERDRYADLLRAASIGVVVLGHWLMAVAVVDARQDAIQFNNVLALVPGLWPATWIFQVMPVFFFVGGFANYRTLWGARAQSIPYGTFVARRVSRLLKPVLFFLAVWVPLAALLGEVGIVKRDMLATITVPVSQPLWFIGVYLIVTALAPPLLLLHLRYRAAVPVALLLATAAVDLLRLKWGISHVAVLNVAFVWLLAQQLGFFYADGTLAKVRRPLLLLSMVCCLALIGVLTHLGPYPRSMVGLPGEQMSNMNPPTVCLAVLAIFQASLIALLKNVASRWLLQERPWLVVLILNSRIMTIYLWHLTALLLALPLLSVGAFPAPPPASATWWITRIPWVLLLSLLTAVLVVVFGRFERSSSPKGGENHGPVGTILAAASVALIALGVLGVSAGGIVDFWYPHGRRLVVLPISPFISLTLLLAGLFLLRPRRVLAAF